MGSIARRRAALQQRTPASGWLSSPQSQAGAAAWLALIPCALLVLLAVVVLGPPLSRVLYPTRLPFRFLPADPETVTPEPLESTRYLLSLTAPALLVAAVLALVHRRVSLSTRMAALVRGGAQIAAALFLVACVIGQHRPKWGSAYFTAATLLVAALVAIVLVLVARSASLRGFVARWTTDTRVRRAVLLTIAALLTALWTTPALNTERSIASAINFHDAAFHLDETFAVINGLTPLKSFTAQYASLLPFLLAGSLLAFGKTYLVFTIGACTMTIVSLLSIYGVLRRAAESALLGLLLFLPFMATSLFNVFGDSVTRFTFGTYFPMFPFRYGVPYMAAWLLAWQLQRRARVTWPVFLAGGLALLNNFEFGFVAVAATCAAALWTSPSYTGRALLRLAVEAVVGLGAAIFLYSALTVLREGSPPDFASAIQFARLYGTAGYSVAPMPGVVGLPLVIFTTYLAAIAVATVRALERAPNRVLTGMLVWSGVFGLGTGSYYVARSNVLLMPATFSAWSLALALLTVVTLQALAASTVRRPSIAMLAALFGMGIAVCSVAQAPLPWAQLQRLHHHPAGLAAEPASNPLIAPITPSRDPRVRRFVSSLAEGPDRFVVRRGAPIALFATAGHRIADAYDVADVVPYTGPESIHTVEELERSFEALRSAGGNTALVEPDRMLLIREGLRRHGFAALTHHGLRRRWPGEAVDWHGLVVVGGLTKWVDTRHLHPTALR